MKNIIVILSLLIANLFIAYSQVPSLELVYPTSGAIGSPNEICNTGTLKIQWNSSNISTIDISISNNGGINFVPIANGIDASLGEFNWNIPNHIYSEQNTVIKISNTISALESQANNLVIYDTPNLIEESKGIVKCENDYLELFVVSNGSNLTYQWFRDGIAITGANQSLYIIPEIEFYHSGVYHCEISGNSNCQSVRTKDIAVYVARLTQITVQPKANLTIIGQTAQLSFDAHLNGIPPSLGVEIQWYRDGVALTDNNKTWGVNSNILTINDINNNDFGKKYYFSLKGLCNPIVWSDTVTLEHINLFASISSIDTALCIGSNISFASTVVVSPPNFDKFKYQWYKDGIILQDNQVIKGSKSEVLNIMNISPNNAGDYTLEVILEESKLSTFASGVNKIDVLIKPEINLLHELIQVKEGLASVPIIVQKNIDDIELEWYKDGYLIPNKSDTLIISNAKIEDSGVYQVLGRNQCGEAYTNECLVEVLENSIISDLNIENNSLKNISVIPNPVNSNTKISISNDGASKFEVKLIDITGSSVFESVFENTNGKVSFTLDVNKLNLQSGNYFLIIHSDTKIITEKISVIK